MDSLELRKILSKNIKAGRIALHISQEKLAEFADLSMQMVNDIEGARTWVSDKTLVKLAQILNLEPSQLLSSEQPVTPPDICHVNDAVLKLKTEVNQEIDKLFRKTMKDILNGS
ncbi:MAG: helix-turn-helix domain-containing protein [Treponemataceae bacterium]